MAKTSPRARKTKRFSFVSLKQSIQRQIDQIEKLPKSTKKISALAKLKAMKRLAPCPPQIMISDLTA